MFKTTQRTILHLLMPRFGCQYFLSIIVQRLHECLIYKLHFLTLLSIAYVSYHLPPLVGVNGGVYRTVLYQQRNMEISLLLSHDNDIDTRPVGGTR